MVTAYLERYATPAGLAGVTPVTAVLRASVAAAARRLAAEGLLDRHRRQRRPRAPGDLVAVTATGVVLAECAAERRHRRLARRRRRRGRARADLRARPAPRGVRRQPRPPRSCTRTRRTPPPWPACSTSCRSCTTSSSCSAARSGSRRTPPSARPSSPPARARRPRRPAGRADGQPRLGRRRRARSPQAVEHALLLEWLCRAPPPRQRARHAAPARPTSSRPPSSTAALEPQLRHAPQENPMTRPPKVAAVGVHVLDTHVIGIESIPDGSEGQLVETIRMLPGRHRRRHRPWCSAGSAPRCTSFGAVGARPDRRHPPRPARARGRRHRPAWCARPASRPRRRCIPVRPNGDRPAWHCIGANGAFTLDDLDRSPWTGSTTCTSAARSSSAGGGRPSCSRRPARSGATTSVDVLAPGDPDLLAWIADALPHTDYLLPNDEQVLGFTGADDAGRRRTGAASTPGPAASR